MSNGITTFKIKLLTSSILALACTNLSIAAPLTLSQDPLFLSSNTPPDVMVMFGNSNSMDEQPDGQAVGSASSLSKSEIARQSVMNVINSYAGQVDLGLMGYQQSGIYKTTLSNSQYDASYNPAYYNPNWTGSRTSSDNKKFRTVNPSDSSRYIYYNVALPGYGLGTHPMYCFTTDNRSKAFNNGEVVTNQTSSTGAGGPWLSYGCYSSKNGIVDAGPTSLSANNPAPTSNPSVAGYSGYLGGGAFYPTDSDLAQGITNFGNQIAAEYVSPTFFTDQVDGNGFVHVPILPLTNTQINHLDTKLATESYQQNANTATNTNFPLINAGLSPIAGAVNTAVTYFTNTAGLPSNQKASNFPPPPNSCSQKFLLLLTDGLPSVLSNGQASSDTSALLNDLTTTVSNAKNNNGIVTFIIGFALPYGVNPSQLTSIAQAGGTSVPYYATDSATLNSALGNVFQSIMSMTSSISAVTLNTGYISNGTDVYQARFNSSDWSGDLLDIPLTSSGGLPSNIVQSANWRAAVTIGNTSYSNRVILTYKPSSGIGIPFEWPSNPSNPGANELDASQSSPLNVNPSTSLVDGEGQQRLNWLRGDRSNEGTLFRSRSTALGDIIDSAPLLVQPPSNSNLSASYLAFESAYANREPVVYIGSNDGMMHGFDAATGQDVLDYVPNAIFGKLNQLTSQNYAHSYYDDGTPASNDVQYSDSSWHTVLVSGMGIGAKGVFSLDVTDPSRFSESNASSIVKFEYTDADNQDIGYIQQPPSIMKLNNGHWGAIFGNGWNDSGNGKADLFVVDIETGSLIKELTTSVGTANTPNGLANPAVIDVDGNGTADYAYAGDIYGNMWKFDLTDSNPANWHVSYSGQPLFSAGSSQPITTQPQVSVSPNGGYMVYFGTGMYLQQTDLTNTNQQAFYGIWDDGATVSSSQLLSQPIGASTPTNVNYPTQKGWYVDFANSGERSVTNSLLSGGAIFFSTLTPSSAACSYGGYSTLYSLDYLNGYSSATSPIGGGTVTVSNSSGTSTSNGQSIYHSNGNANTGNGQNTGGGTITSIVSFTGISSAPSLLKGLGSQNSPQQELFFNLSSGNVVGMYTSGSSLTDRRIAWHRIFNN